MAHPVKSVVFVGASGNIGDVILPYLLEQKDAPKLSVLTRENSTAQFPDSINIIKTDYTPDSLEKSLRGQDVVISLLSHDVPLDQKIIIDAAVKAGIKRFFPSEFGIRTNEPRIIAEVDLAYKKHKIVEHLKKTEDKMSWTAVITNPWLDFGILDNLLGFNLQTQEAEIFDGGDIPWSTCTRLTIGQIFYSFFTDAGRFEEAKNQYIHIEGRTVTANEILVAFEKVTRSKWTVIPRNSAEIIPQAKEAVKAGQMMGVGNLVRCLTWGRVYENENLGDFRSLNPWDRKLNLPEINVEQVVQDIADGKWTIIHHPPAEIPQSMIVSRA